MNKLEIFKNERFGEIRIAGTSEEPLFCLADVCKAVDLQNPSSVKSRLDSYDVQLVDLHALNPTEGNIIGNSTANFINESAFYDVILQSCSPKVKPFRKWITSEVLPTIRKTGGYVARTEDFVESYFGNLDDTTKQFLVTTLDDKKRLLEENKRQKVLIEEQAPKAEFFDAVAESKTAVPMNEVAKVLNIQGYGRNNLFEFLRKRKVLMNNNQPYQNYISLGYFRVIEQKYMKNDEVCINFKTLVYQKGVDFIRKLVKENKNNCVKRVKKLG